MQEQEKSNMSELVSKAEETGKNPAIASVVANTIALMKKQKKNMDGPFSSLFKTLHSEEMMQTKQEDLDMSGSPIEVKVDVKVNGQPANQRDIDEQKAIDENNELNRKAKEAVEGAKSASE